MHNCGHVLPFQEGLRLAYQLKLTDCFADHSNPGSSAWPAALVWLYLLDVSLVGAAGPEAGMGKRRERHLREGVRWSSLLLEVSCLWRGFCLVVGLPSTWYNWGVRVGVTFLPVSALYLVLLVSMSHAACCFSVASHVGGLTVGLGHLVSALTCPSLLEAFSHFSCSQQLLGFFLLLRGGGSASPCCPPSPPSPVVVSCPFHRGMGNSPASFAVPCLSYCWLSSPGGMTDCFPPWGGVLMGADCAPCSTVFVLSALQHV